MQTQISQKNNYNMPPNMVQQDYQNPDNTSPKVWDQALNTLKDSVPISQFSVWIQPLNAIESHNKLSLFAPNKEIFDYINSHLKKPIKNAVAKHNKNLKIYISTIPDTTKNQIHQTKLSPEYSFENLVQGDANQIAASAARQIATNIQASPYNPYIIYGESGLGKTHLMQATGHLALQNNPKSKIIFVPLMDFVKNITSSIRHNNIEKTKFYYQSADLLLIDDIHLIAGKEKSQEEFFHIFNFLFSTKKQIICTCDQPPKNIKALQERLKTRFSQGLNLQLLPPELEMRAAILMKKSQDPKINLNLNDELALFIAGNITANVRLLEGALLKLKAFVDFSKIKHDNITQETVENALGDLIRNNLKNLEISDIKKETAKHYNIHSYDLTSKSRQQKIVIARQMAIIITHELTSHSLAKIGKHFGDRDHSTVIHAIKKTKERLKTQATTRKDYDTIKLKLANI